MSALLSMENITKTFRTGGLFSKQSKTVLRDFSLLIQPGERVGLQGPSGSGKTTVARLATGLTKPDSGTLHILGQNSTSWTERQWAKHRSEIQILYQDPKISLNPMLTLAQNLAETQLIHRNNNPLEDLVDQMGIGHLLHRTPMGFSGGEWRRAALARVLLANPKILIADEPTTGLDFEAKKNILDLLLSATTASRALLLISHDEATLQYATERRVQLEAH